MIDSNSQDYTINGRDVLVVPDDEWDRGISILSEPEPPNLTRVNQLEAPLERRAGGASYFAPQRPLRQCVGQRGGRREHMVASPNSQCGPGPCGTFPPRVAPGASVPPPVGRWNVGGGGPTGGEAMSDRGTLAGIYDVSFDDRPQHYSPDSGDHWSHLIVQPWQRPYGGGPSPSLAHPPIYHSEAIINPNSMGGWPPACPVPGADVGTTPPNFGLPQSVCTPLGGNCWKTEGAGREGFAAAPPPSSGSVSLKLLMCVLLIVLLVFAALILASNMRLERQLERTMAAAPRAGQVPPGG